MKQKLFKSVSLLVILALLVPYGLDITSPVGALAAPEQSQNQPMLWDDLGSHPCMSNTDVFSIRSDGQWLYSSGATTEWIEDELASSNKPLENLRFGDFDGNGKTDVFRVGTSNNWRISYDATQSWAYGINSDVPLDQLRFGDFDGDGQTDVFSIRSDGQWRYSSGATTAWIEDELASSNYALEEFRFGDFDGNGKTDVFRVDAGNNWKISYDAANPWDAVNNSDVPLDQLRFGDFDDDDRTDVFSVRSDGQWRYSSGAIMPWIEDELVSSNIAIEEFRFGDFDGNGKTDIFRIGSDNTWKISYDSAQPWADGSNSAISLDQLRFGNFDDLECNNIYLPVVKQDPEYIPPVIPETTKVLSEQTTQNLSSISSDGTVFTFTQPTSELEDVSAGDVIVADVSDVAPDGFLRKVTSVAVSEGGQVIVETEDATLEDAIEDGSAYVSETLSVEDVESFMLAEGVSLVTSPQSVEGIEFKFKLETVLYEHEGKQITAKGEISLNHDFQFNVKIKRRKLKELYFGIETTETATLKIESGFEYSKDKEIEIVRKIFRARTIFIGVVPIRIRPVLSVYVGLNGSVSVGVSTEVGQSVRLTAGLKYYDGKWSTPTGFSTERSFAHPTLSARLNFRGYAGVKLELLVYGLAGPYVAVEGYLKLKADLLPAPPWWKLYIGLDAPVGFIGRVFKKDLFDKSLTIHIYEELLDEGNIKPSEEYDITVTVIGNGSVNNTPGNPYLNEEIATLEPVADPGWYFVGWSGPDAGELADNMDGSWSITMNGDKAVTATFAQEEYDVTVTVIGNGSVNNTPGNPYLYEEVATLEPVADPGWYFGGWSGPDADQLVFNPDVEAWSLTMDGDKAVTATFADITTEGRYVAFISEASNLVSGDTNGFADIFVRDTQTNTTTRVSVASDGTQGNSHSGGVPNPFHLAISADGRYVAFVSEASNLVSGDTNDDEDIFVRDTQTNTTTRVSVASDGTQGNGDSHTPAMSADGRYVAFTSLASNLVSGDINGLWDTFVRDTQTNTTTRVSVASDGTQTNADSWELTISADGRYVAFHSWASNLVSGDTNGFADIFVRDTQTNTTTLISVASDGTQGNSYSYTPLFSADGRYMAFISNASNLVSGDTNEDEDVFVRDTQTNTTTRVSVASDGTEANGHSWNRAISADGRYVAYISGASNLVSGDTNSYYDVFVRDIQANTTTRVSVASDGTEANSDSWNHAISGDGRYVAFESYASNLVSGDTYGLRDIFVRDTQTNTTTRVSVASDGTQGNGESCNPAFSADGRYVEFDSYVSNLLSGDTNGFYDIFVNDTQTNTPTRVLIK